ERHLAAGGESGNAAGGFRIGGGNGCGVGARSFDRFPTLSNFRRQSIVTRRHNVDPGPCCAVCLYFSRTPGRDARSSASIANGLNRELQPMLAVSRRWPWG